MPYNQVSKVNWKRSWEVAVPEPVAKTPDVVPLPAPPPGILVNRAARHYGPCPLCISSSRGVARRCRLPGISVAFAALSSSMALFLRQRWFRTDLMPAEDAAGLRQNGGSGDHESKLAGGMKARGRYRSRSLSASSTDSYSSGKSAKNARD
ncbi:hypothetical protein IscW_ISCW016594 [Ixodes scapularis]|uniref:Uncharacterized protein n=1 Tax=Ixodes scapularis TaxID=6945 RepID=B7PCR1_IXOSC|nr:hypothetical protein IscW_ISCW016594 [Ixodes scapularis]|eukprot:XP_002410135.1 hypothetical protein IscW_ISCW016594 [Ixodes scapularis]